MAEPGDTLSERELDVLRCLVSGASNKDIAADLTISENTVKVHLRNIYTKLAVSSRTEATTEAMQQGLVAIPGQEVASTAVADQPYAAEHPPEGALAAANGGGVSAQTAALEKSTPQPAGAAWRWALGIIVALLALAGISFVIMQFVDLPLAMSEEEPFEETSIENTRWLATRPMPDARANMAVATVGLDLYQIGGETESGVDGQARAFNSVDRSWRPVAEKPTAVADASAAELYGEVYVAGGILPDGEPTSAVEAYSPTQDAWRPVASLPHPVAGALTVSDGSFLYVIGGHDGTDFLDTAYVYDPATNSWRPLPNLPEPRRAATGATLTGQIIVVGGEDENGASDACYTFDVIAESWQDCPPMLSSRQDAGSAVLLNRLYVIGGVSEKQEITFSEMYDPTSETWQVINTPMLADSDSWPNLGVGQIESRIYAFGGRDQERLRDETFVFAPLIYQTYIPAATSPEEN